MILFECVNTEPEFADLNNIFDMIIFKTLLFCQKIPIIAWYFYNLLEMFLFTEILKKCSWSQWCYCWKISDFSLLIISALTKGQSALTCLLRSDIKWKSKITITKRKEKAQRTREYFTKALLKFQIILVLQEWLIANQQVTLYANTS